MTTKSENSILEVPGQISEEFLSQLDKSEVPKDIISRLRKVVLEEKRLTYNAVREAILPEV